MFHLTEAGKCGTPFPVLFPQIGLIGARAQLVRGIPAQFCRFLGGNPVRRDVPLSHEDYPDDNQRYKNKEKRRPVEKCADN
jgi:hypothetical protein